MNIDCKYIVKCIKWRKLTNSYPLRFKYIFWG